MRDDALERNVRLLLQRSYVPALPTPPFRDRLESLFLAEVEQREHRSGARRRAQPARLLPFPASLRFATALAAALLALFLGWRVFSGDAADPRARLLARGEVALGFRDGSWRAADEEERVQGLDLAQATLIVVTPAGAELDVLLHARFGGGWVHVNERSELALEQDREVMVATLRSGSAWLQRGDERSLLVAGAARRLRAAELEPTPPVASTTVPASREALPSGARPEAPPAQPDPTRGLAGTVSTASDGAPLPAFSVALLAERKGHATYPPVRREFASPEGTFRWPDPLSGKQRVFVHAPGYALLEMGEIDFDAVEVENVIILRAQLVPGVSVRGSVLDEEGNPIPNALVFSEDEVPADGLFFSLPALEQTFWLPNHARTGPDGRFELAHLNPGRHTLRAGAEGFAPAWKAGVSAPCAPEAELDFTLGPGGTVEGVVKRDDGGPWAGAEVVVVAMDQVERTRMSFDHTRTDGEGRYRFEHLPAMTMIVVSMRVADSPEVRPVQVVEGETMVANFEPPRRGVRLHGRVLTRDGKPLARQSLGLFDAETASWNQDWVATTTHADGGYAFEGVVPGRYQIFLIDDMGRGLRCVDAFLVAPDSVEVEHEVRISGGRLAVTVFDAQSAEPAGETALTLMRTDEDGGESFSAFGLSDAEGHFEFVDLRPGTYHVGAYPTRAGLGLAESERVSVAGDERVALEIQLEPGGALDVVVRGPDGRPLEGAVVVFYDEAGGEHTFSRLPLTDAAGRYRASCVRPGLYRVAAELAGHQGTPVEFRFELGYELEVPVVLVPIQPR